MIVRWSRHSKERYLERELKYGLTYDEMELEIIRQKIRVEIGRKKFKTIFKIGGNFITIVKAENDKKITVLTIWESSVKEAAIWKNAL